MKSIHFICKRQGTGLRGLSLNSNPYSFSSFEISQGEGISGFWDIKESEAERLVDGFLFLHEVKSRKASFAGKIIDYEVVVLDEFQRSKRVAFKLKALNAHANPTFWPKNGASHAMAHCSGVVSFAPTEKNKALGLGS